LGHPSQEGNLKGNTPQPLSRGEFKRKHTPTPLKSELAKNSEGFND